jgi:hypothetical protein
VTRHTYLFKNIDLCLHIPLLDLVTNFICIIIFHWLTKESRLRWKWIIMYQVNNGLTLEQVSPFSRHFEQRHWNPVPTFEWRTEHWLLKEPEVETRVASSLLTSVLWSPRAPSNLENLARYPHIVPGCNSIWWKWTGVLPTNFSGHIVCHNIIQAKKYSYRTLLCFSFCLSWASHHAPQMFIFAYLTIWWKQSAILSGVTFVDEKATQYLPSALSSRPQAHK